MGLISIEVSEKRDEVRSISLSEKTVLKSWGAVFIKFGKSHLLPSSICLESEDIVIYVDPLMVDAERKADYIFITHDHADHLSIPDIEKLADEETVIICPKKAAKKLKGYSTRVVSPGDKVEFMGLSFEAVPAYSIGFPSHPKSSGNVGYVIAVDGKRIYHAGDTDLVPEIEILNDIDVALVPIDGANLTMKTQEAAQLVNEIKPRIAIPIHYVVDENKTEEFKKLVDRDIEVLIIAK